MPVRVESAELLLLRMPLRAPFRSAVGVTTHRTVLLVVLRGEGLEGLGECVAEEQPSYWPETVSSAMAVLEQVLLPGVVGRDFPNPQALATQLAWVRGNAMARAALEMAFWDLWARSLQRPLWQLLGGVRERVAVGAAVGIRASVEETVQAVEQAAGEGYLRVKLKIRPGWDVAVVQAVRQSLPAVALAVDANGAYGPGDLPVLRALDDMGLAYIEQPLAWDDLDDHAWLQQQLRTAVVLDESVPSARHAGRALALRACRAINIKPGRMGGHHEAVRAHHVAEAFRVPVLCGGMLESGVGRAHNLHLATLPQFTWPADMSGSNRYWEHDIVQPELQAHQGWIPVPPGPGTGVALDPDRLRRVLVERRPVRP